jgi:hypothetical protein
MILKKDLILKSGKRLQENSFGKRYFLKNELLVTMNIVAYFVIGNFECYSINFFLKLLIFTNTVGDPNLSVYRTVPYPTVFREGPLRLDRTA